MRDHSEFNEDQIIVEITMVFRNSRKYLDTYTSKIRVKEYYDARFIKIK